MEEAAYRISQFLETLRNDERLYPQFHERLTRLQSQADKPSSDSAEIDRQFQQIRQEVNETLQDSRRANFCAAHSWHEGERVWSADHGTGSVRGLSHSRTGGYRVSVQWDTGRPFLVYSSTLKSLDQLSVEEAALHAQQETTLAEVRSQQQHMAESPEETHRIIDVTLQTADCQRTLQRLSQSLARSFPPTTEEGWSTQLRQAVLAIAQDPAGRQKFAEQLFRSAKKSLRFAGDVRFASATQVYLNEMIMDVLEEQSATFFRMERSKTPVKE